MYTVSFGFVNVAVAGTPVPMSAVLTSLGLDANLKVHTLEFAPKNANTHVGYVGLAGTTNGGANPQAPSGDFSKTSGVGLLAEIQFTTAGSQKKDVLHVSCAQETNAVRVADYAVDAGANGEGFVIFATVL